MRQGPIVDRDSTRGAKWRPFALAGALAGLAIFFAIGTAAGAGSGGLEYLTKSKSVPSTDSREFDAVFCPHGQSQIIGGGVEITGDNSDLGLEVGSTSPTRGGDPGSWFAEAINSSASPAQMTVTAICARGRFAYQRRERLVAAGGQDQLKAPCPAGTKVTGGGVITATDSLKVDVASTEPFDGPDPGSTPDDGWLGTANNGKSSSTRMVVLAACAKSGHYRYVHSAREPLPDNSEASAEARCPAGTTVTGGGIDNSGIDIGAEIRSTFPFDGGDIGFTPDDGWEGSANNDDTGRSERMQAFAICRVSEIRNFSGTVNGGTVTFKTKFEGGKTVKVLPGLTLGDVPTHCSNADTTHTVIVDDARKVRNSAFGARAASEVGQPHAAFTLAGHFNRSGTEASGTYREHGNLKSANGTFVFTHCDTGTVHWSAEVDP